MHTAGAIARKIGAELEGDSKARLRGVASPERAGAEELVYADSAKGLARAASSAARCVVVAQDARLPGKTLLKCANPKLAFVQAAALLVPAPSIASGVHRTAVIARSAKLGKGAAVGPYAVIEENAVIGAGSQIGAFCFVGRGARLGMECLLFPHAVIYPGAKLGARVILHSGAVVGADGFGYVFGEGRQWKFPQVGAAILEDEVEIGANTTIDRGALDETHLAAEVKLDNLVHVGHNTRIGAHTVIAAQTGIAGSCHIGERVMMGGQVGLGDHCAVEDGAIIGGQSGILNGKTARAGHVLWGTPARPLERFKEQYAWLARLPKLGERLRKFASSATEED